MSFTSRKDQLNHDEPISFDSAAQALDWATIELTANKTQARLIEKRADRDAQVLLELEHWTAPESCAPADLLITRPNWLVQDYIENGHVGFLSGIYGSGKSFLALDWACCVATGTSWFDHRIGEGNVLYIAAEGGQGIGRRYAAWCKENNRSARSETLDFILAPVQLGYPVAVDWLVKRVIDFEADFLIIDTLARSIDGLNENDSIDMAKVITALYQLRDARGENMTTVLVVHHTGWGDQTRSRGSSRLPSDTDYSFTTARKTASQSFTLTCSKLKEDRMPEEFSFELATVEVAHDTTSCVIRPKHIVTGEPAVDQVSPRQRILGALAMLEPQRQMQLVSNTGLSEATISRYCRDMLAEKVLRYDPDTRGYIRPTRPTEADKLVNGKGKKTRY